MKKKKEKKEKAKKKRLTLKQLLATRLPAAIESNINPLLTVGTGVLLSSILIFIIPSFRSTSPLFLLLGAVITGYALWQKADVIKKGYEEYIFKVVDYTYLGNLLTKYRTPTGMLLLMKDEEGNDIIENDGNMYHVAVSGKEKVLPPIDWLIRVYVPKGSMAAQYGDKKYFPTVYGYRIEGEDK